MLAEWHLSPDYIVDNWTDELFCLMCEKLVERKRREVATIEKTRDHPRGATVTDSELFNRANNMIKVEKRQEVQN